MSKVVLKAGFPCAFRDGIIQTREDKFPHYFQDAIVGNYKLKEDIIVEGGWSSKTISDLVLTHLLVYKLAEIESKLLNRMEQLKTSGWNEVEANAAK